MGGGGAPWLLAATSSKPNLLKNAVGKVRQMQNV